MSLASILDISEKRERKVGMSEERLREQLPHLRTLISFFREYPDLFVDFIKGEDCKFKFYFYQRIFLRLSMRHKYLYATFARGYSKSFLSILTLILRCILFPGSDLFVSTGQKDQASSITISKVQEICALIPALHNEIDWSRGASKHSKDNVDYQFKNNSKLNILAARESSRGQRRIGGLIEEVILVDGDVLNEVLIPTTAIDRLLPDGTRDKDEITNKSLIYITTAGWKNSFAYEKLIETLVQSIVEPDLAVVIGGTYNIPVIEGLQPADYIEQLRLTSTFKEESFDREYLSVWCGDSENAFFSSEKIEHNRVLVQPEYEYSGRSSKSAFYVLGIDVGRLNDQTEVVVIKSSPQPAGADIKHIVNIHTIVKKDFEDQAIEIKRLYYKYKARVCVVDGNGLGVGLTDCLAREQVDPDSGEKYPAFGVEGSTSEAAVESYKSLKADNIEFNAMYIIKANAPINTEAFSYVQAQLSSGKIKFLIDEQKAKMNFLGTAKGQKASASQRQDYLTPYVQTSILSDQMLNLVEKNDGVNILLQRSSKAIKKDKFSALAYGLYYIKKQEEKSRRKRKRNISEMMFFT